MSRVFIASRHFTFNRFLKAALIAHPHPFVRDFARDNLGLPLDPRFPKNPKSYREVKAYLVIVGACRHAMIGAALAWRTYQRIRRDVVVS